MIPKWLSLGLVVVIFAVAFVYARIQGPVEEDALADEAGARLADDDER